MKTSLIVILSFSISVLFAQRALKTEFPNIKHAKILSAVTKSKNSEYFYFNYSLVNRNENTGKIRFFKIDVSRSPKTIEIDTAGLLFFSKYNQFNEKTNRRGYQIAYGKITPVGFPVLPNKFWEASINNNYRLAWFSTYNSFPQPGDTIKDFIMMSKGIPGLRSYRIEPLFFSGQYVLSEEEDTVENAPLPPIHRGNIDSVEKSLAVTGITVGPISPPMNFIPSVWIDTLISYKHQSRALGWIDNDGIVNSLDQKLDNAKQQLEKGNTNSAKNIIQAFINEVEAQNGKHLTSEAYALLKYNAEYLLEKMGGK